jgi:hypothetical protein
MEFQSWYDIAFPQSGSHSAASDGKRAITYTVTLTTPELPASERERLSVSYRERLAWIEQEIRDAHMPVTDRMTWRCYALARLHLHQEFFALEHLGLMLLANDVRLGKEYTRLHELLEAAMQLPPVPDMDVYYQLPDFVPNLDPATESTPPGDEDLSQDGKSPLEILVERFHFQVLTRDDGRVVLDNNIHPIIFDPGEYEGWPLDEILQKLFIEAEVFDAFPDTTDPLDVFIKRMEEFSLFQTKEDMQSHEVYDQLRMLKGEFRIKQGYVAQFKAVLGAAYKQFVRAIHPEIYSE